MKHFLFVLWFLIALAIFEMIRELLKSLAIHGFGLKFDGSVQVLIFLVGALIIGEFTLVVYKNLYKKV